MGKRSFAQKMLIFFFFEKKIFWGEWGVFAKRRNLARSPSFIPVPVFHFRPPSIPAKAGISRGGIVRHASPQATLHFRFAEFPAGAGRDSRFRGNGIWRGNGKSGGMERWGNGSIFLPPAACGGGCERDSGRGGWSVADDVWNFATPQKFALRIFTPPRKRRGVRFRLSPEWKCGYWGGAGNACTAPLITCRGKPLPAFFATPESHALPLRCRCRRRQFSASPSGRCRCRSRSHQCSLRR